MNANSPKLRPEWVAPARTALLVVDLQVDFASPDGAMARGGAEMSAVPAALERITSLVAAARGAGVTCIFSRVSVRPQAQSAVEREARARHGNEDEAPLCAEGSPGAEFIAPRPRAGELVITKSRYSAFAGTGLEAALKARGLDTLVLCGLTTECCVQSSAWDAFERDLHVLIAADACAAYDARLHQGALAALAVNGAILANTADLLATWK